MKTTSKNLYKKFIIKVSHYFFLKTRSCSLNFNLYFVKRIYIFINIFFMCLMANSASVSNLMFFRLLIIYKCLFYLMFQFDCLLTQRRFSLNLILPSFLNFIGKFIY